MAKLRMKSLGTKNKVEEQKLKYQSQYGYWKDTRLLEELKLWEGSPNLIYRFNYDLLAWVRHLYTEDKNREYFFKDFPDKVRKKQYAKCKTCLRGE